MTTICLPEESARTFLPDLPSGVRVLVWDGAGPAPDGIEDVEFFVGPYGGAVPGREAVLRMPRLRVLQVMSAGVDAWLALLRDAPAGVVLCNGRGVHGATTAELAVAGILAVLRRVPEFVLAQREHDWSWRLGDTLAGRNVLILGAGDIGARIATAVRPFDAVPTLVGRRTRDGVIGMDGVPALLSRQHAVVVALPATSQTRGLVDADFLAALPDGAVVANVARGPIVDTAALLAETRSGRLRAYLDVTDPEPLPPEHPLWSLPNVLITPHVGGGAQRWQERAYALVGQQVYRYLRGEALVNVVDVSTLS